MQFWCNGQELLAGGTSNSLIHNHLTDILYSIRYGNSTIQLVGHLNLNRLLFIYPVNYRTEKVLCCGINIKDIKSDFILNSLILLAKYFIHTSFFVAFLPLKGTLWTITLEYRFIIINNCYFYNFLFMNNFYEFYEFKGPLLLFQI